MDIDIRFDTTFTEQVLKQFVAKYPEAQKRAIGVAGNVLFVASRSAMLRLIYQKEIPKGKNGKPLWRRKMRAGGMLGAETYAMSVDGSTFIVFTDPSSLPAKAITRWPGGYAQRRHWRDGKYTKAAPWRSEAKAKAGERAIRKFKDELEKDAVKNWRTL
jgi:hypothetical protein